MLRPAPSDRVVRVILRPHLPLVLRVTPPPIPLSYVPHPPPCLTPPPIPLSYVPLPPTCAPDGSDPFVASPKGATAMELAVLSGSAKIVRRFESKALFAGDVDVQVRGARAPCGRHGGRPGVEMSLT